MIDIGLLALGRGGDGRFCRTIQLTSIQVHPIGGFARTHLDRSRRSLKKIQLKLSFSKKATKIEEIFTVDLTLCNKCQIYGEDFLNFRGLLVKYELYKSIWMYPIFLSRSEFPIIEHLIKRLVNKWCTTRALMMHKCLISPRD